MEVDSEKEIDRLKEMIRSREEEINDKKRECAQVSISSLYIDLFCSDFFVFLNFSMLTCVKSFFFFPV